MTIANPVPAPIELENLTAQIAYQPEKFTHKLLLERENQKTLLFAFAKGQSLKTHTTPLSALLVMLEGVCHFKIHGHSQLLIAGETITIPAGVPHSLVAATDFKMLLIK